MTYLYYKTSTLTSTNKPNEKTINQWEHLADKKNWSRKLCKHEVWNWFFIYNEKKYEKVGKYPIPISLTKK